MIALRLFEWWREAEQERDAVSPSGRFVVEFFLFVAMLRGNETKNNMKNLLTLLIPVFALGAFTSCSDVQSQPDVKALPPSPTASPEGAKAYFISPKNGDTVDKTFTVQFGLKGLGVAPAGVFVDGKPTGHHHLVLDAETPNMKLPFPMSDNYLHFGGGQTEAELTLKPGQHKLQMVVGDHNHFPHQPPLVSEMITITVK